MNRNQLIHNTLKDAMQSLNYDVLSSGDIESFTATGIGEKLNLSRSSISLELNKLSKDGKLIYIKSRPVIFFDKKLFNIKLILFKTISLFSSLTMNGFMVQQLSPSSQKEFSNSLYNFLLTVVFPTPITPFITINFLFILNRIM